MESVFYHVTSAWTTSKGPERWEVYGYASCKLIAGLRMVEGLRKLFALACTRGDRAVSGMLLKQTILDARHTPEPKWARILERYTLTVSDPVVCQVMADQV